MSNTDKFDIADAFDDYAEDQDRSSSQSTTSSFWEFCEDHPLGQSVIGNPDLEKEVRNLLYSRGWSINQESSFSGENADFNDNLDAVLNNE